MGWEDQDTPTATPDVVEEDDDDLDFYYQDEEDTPLSILQDIYRIFHEDSDDEEFEGF